MKKNKIVAFIFVFKFACCGIRESYNLDPITNVSNLDILEKIAEDISEQKAQETVFIFDMDNTLITDRSACLQSQNRDEFHKILVSSFSGIVYEMLYSNIYVASRWQCRLVDDKFIKVTNLLNKKNGKMLILTYSSHGRYGVFDPNTPVEWFYEFGLTSKIESFADFRIAQLRELGISIEPWFSDLYDIPKIFNGEGTNPLFKNNFVFCNHQSSRGIEANDENRKHLVLARLFEILAWWPSAIVWIDDNKERITEACALFSGMNIEFVGLHYLGAKKFERSFNSRIAFMQINHAIKSRYKSWLDDASAARMLAVSCTECSSAICSLM